MKVYIPNNNLCERIYIIDILCGEFLGVDYKVIPSKREDYKIVLQNGHSLILEDHFFNHHPQELSYLHNNNIPNHVHFTGNPFIKEHNIPIIFGTQRFKTTTETIECGLDIFASAFFMLSRWEEHVISQRDEHKRFLLTDSLAYKHGFLDRPVVNEYTHMLWQMLLYLGYQGSSKTRAFELVLTHDVDVIRKYRRLSSGLHEIVDDLLIRKNFSLAFKNITQKLKVHLKITPDPFDTFGYLMDLSEQLDTKSYFFFMAQGTTVYDNSYKSHDSTVLKIIQHIKKRGHHIGIHPSYNAYNSTQQFAKEREELEKNFKTNIRYGRQHYLRFEVPTTWQVWEDNAMLWDSSVYFSQKEGFRCGVCFSFSVFNILTQKKLHVKERPLLVMDVSFSEHQPHLSSHEVAKRISSLLQCVKSYNGEFVLLWHNSSFNTQQWKRFHGLLEKVLLS